MSFMVEYYTEDGRNPDCHPDFFDFRDDAEREGKEFMAHLPWAASMKVVEVPALYGDFSRE
jgi:hypothetical protein